MEYRSIIVKWRYRLILEKVFYIFGAFRGSNFLFKPRKKRRIIFHFPFKNRLLAWLSFAHLSLISVKNCRLTPNSDFAEIRADYGDGTGVHLIGTTAFSRFGDHREIPEGRTLFKYWVCYITRDGLQLGQQSTCDVTVTGRVN